MMASSRLSKAISDQLLRPRLSILGKTSSRYSSTTNIVTDAKVTEALPEYGTFAMQNQVLPRAVFGGIHTVAMLSGDGIGPEMMQHVKRVYKQLGAPIAFEEVNVSHSSNEHNLEEAILAIKRNGIAIKGNLETRPGETSKNLAIRCSLDLFAYVQRCLNFPGVKTRHAGVDIVVIRENTEGEYSRLEHENIKGVVESLKVITETKSRRVAEFAFNYAAKHGRRKVTAVHKANIMKLGDGLFLNTCADVAKSYPEIKFDSIIVDNCCMQLVSRPQQFDVMLTPNLYGNIIGNVAAGIIGGAGLTCGVNIGAQHAVFEAGTRNSGRSLVGKNVANPIAILLSSSDLLDYIGERQMGHKLRQAIFQVTGKLKLLTADLGGTTTTSEMVDAILRLLADDN